MDDTINYESSSSLAVEDPNHQDANFVNRKFSVSSNTLSDSGCPSTPDGEFLSPPTLSRCVTDSPSHYFLRGNHRWASTPLLKAGGYQRSTTMNIPLSSTPYIKPALVISPPKAHSTPEASQHTGTSDHSLDDNPFSPSCSSDRINSIPSGLSKLDKSPQNQISSLARLSSQEFSDRIETCHNVDNQTLPESKESSSNQDNTSCHKHIDDSSVRLQDGSSHASDSGIGSSRHETSAEESPKRNKTAAAVIIPKLRRSPRSLAIQNRLDRCTRLKVDSSKSKSKIRSKTYIIPAGLYMEWEHLDILMQLRTSNMLHIVDKILSYVSSADLPSVSMTSRRWHKLFSEQVFNHHESRRRSYVETVKLNRENFGREVVPFPLTRSSSRIALKEVNRNISPQNKRNRESSSSGSIISPSKIRSRLFPDSHESIRERRSDKLDHCPNCSATSTIKSYKDKDGKTYEKGECTSRSCSLVFCTTCLHIEHPGKACKLSQPSRSRSVAAVTSKKSKARLRRL